MIVSLQAILVDQSVAAIDGGRGDDAATGRSVHARTIVLVDAGSGTVDDLNWLLARGYEIIAKEYSGRHIVRLAKTVIEWIQDLDWSERSFGWVSEPPTGYVCPVQRTVVRCYRKDNILPIKCYFARFGTAGTHDANASHFTSG